MDGRFMFMKTFCPQGVVCPCPGAIYMYMTIIFKHLLLGKVKFYRKHLYEGGTNVIINKPVHMTKMAAMPIYGKNPSKIFFAGTAEPIGTKTDIG